MQAKDRHSSLSPSPQINEASVAEVWSKTLRLVNTFANSDAVEGVDFFSDDVVKNLLYLIEHVSDEAKKRQSLYCLGSYAAIGYVKNYTLEEALKLVTEAANLGEEDAIQFLAQTYMGMKNDYLKSIGFGPISSQELSVKYGLLAFKQGDEELFGNLCFELIKGECFDKNVKLYRQVYYSLFFDLKLESDEQRLCQTVSKLVGSLTDPFFEPLLLPFVYTILKRWQQSDLWNDTTDQYEALLKYAFEVHARNVDNPRLMILNRFLRVLEEYKLYELLKRPKSYPFHKLQLHEPDLFFGQFIPDVKDLLAMIDQPHEAFTAYFREWHVSSCFDINQPIDDLENTLLHLAVRKNNELFLKYLLVWGANINAQNTFGQTALLMSCENQTVNLVRILLHHDANPEIGDEVGFYPMHFACLQGHREIFRLLLEAKAHCDPVSSYTGATPLLLAIKNNHIEIAKQLLQQGVNLEVKNKRGLGLLYFAMRQNRELTRLLLSVGIAIPEDYKKWSASEELINEIGLVLKMRKKKSIVESLKYYNEDQFPTLKQLVGFSIFKNPNLKLLATEEKLGKDLSEYIEQYLPRNLDFLKEDSVESGMVSSPSVP